MTAERTAHGTVPSPGAQPRDHPRPTVPVVPAPARGAAGGRFPARRPADWPASPVPLLVADLGAAVLGALTLGRSGPAVLLVLAAALLRPHRPPRLGQGALDELPAVCGRVAVAWLALAALVAAYTPERELPAAVLALGFTVHAAADCAGRALVHWRRRVALLRQPRAALVVGPAAAAQRVAAAVLRHPRCGVRPVGIVADQADGAAGLPVLTCAEEVHRALIQNGVRDVLVVHPAVRAQHGPLLRALAESGCAVWELDADAPWYPAPEQLAGFACRRLRPGSGRRAGLRKRVLDVVLSGSLLLAAGPLLLFCALVLRISEGPGVVFRQERIGRDGRPFTLLKLRTHRPADEHESATRWSVANEQAMPWFCRFLRRTSLDELLQLWNVLRGDMSMVGPRPERPYFVAQFSQAHPGYAARHRMPAGITGLAQVNGLRGDTSIEDRARFDNAYIDTWSLWQDVCILLRTAVALVRPTGS
ncbi:exopolysaccharide biosynthesis polyprenyl glycosylphosphotransferase [Streptomyces cinereospinus]|uniref:exopolysaccharide biosynthesis polyprenyl glycosylphosphotransferase n=1 Tax=Streptomyces cinereospinus TaxID=285561 RepID=UPI00360F46A2